MSGTLTTWRTAVLALLDDPALDRFTNDQVDAAIRKAIQRYNVTRPITRTYSVDGCDDYQIVMPADFTTEHITEVWLDNDDDPPTSLTFYAFYRDEQWVVQTINYLVSSSESLLITYTSKHTLDGLDSGAGTTIPANDEEIIQIGAAGYAIQSRAVSRAESINLQPEVTAQLMELAKQYQAQFEAGIAPKPVPSFTAEPELRGDVF